MRLDALIDWDDMTGQGKSLENKIKNAEEQLKRWQEWYKKAKTPGQKKYRQGMCDQWAVRLHDLRRDAESQK